MNLSEKRDVNQEKVVRLLTCNSSSEAHLLKAQLDNVGIDCFLTNENFTNLLPNYNGMMGAGIQIFVRQGDIEKAKTVLQETLHLESTQILCPRCGSTNMEPGYGSGKFKYFLTIIVSLLAAAPFGNIKPNYLCQDCGHES